MSVQPPRRCFRRGEYHARVAPHALDARVALRSAERCVGKRRVVKIQPVRFHQGEFQRAGSPEDFKRQIVVLSNRHLAELHCAEYAVRCLRVHVKRLVRIRAPFVAVAVKVRGANNLRMPRNADHPPAEPCHQIDDVRAEIKQCSAAANVAVLLPPGAPRRVKTAVVAVDRMITDQIAEPPLVNQLFRAHHGS